MRNWANELQNYYGQLNIIAAPTVATALSITGIATAGSNIMTLSDGTVSSAYQSAATSSLFGTTTNHALTLMTNNAGRFTLSAAGGLFAAAATGGDQGIGTINAQGVYINGNQLFFGVPASSNTTAAVTDVGKVINATGTITIPNSVFSQGHALSIYNNSGSSITISASITTMRLAGTATTGSRTLAQRGMATIWFESGTECVVGGPGVT
jgi:hypothetical protein